MGNFASRPTPQNSATQNSATQDSAIEQKS